MAEHVHCSPLCAATSLHITAPSAQPYNLITVGCVQEVFTFEHPNRAHCIDNTRSVRLEFQCTPPGGTGMALLYPAVLCYAALCCAVPR